MIIMKMVMTMVMMMMTMVMMMLLTRVSYDVRHQAGEVIHMHSKNQHTSRQFAISQL